MMIPVVLIISAAVFAAGRPASPALIGLARVVSPGDQATTPPKAGGDAAPEQEVEPIQADTGRWNITLDPYLWAPTVDIEGVIKLTFWDILDDLDMLFMGTLIAEKDGSPWGFQLDAVYFDIEKKDVEIQATILTTYISHRLGEDGPTRLLVGARYWDLDLTVGPLLGGGADWADPVVGASSAVAFTDKWSVNALVDAGGFGIGAAAEFTWQGLGILNYKLNDKVTFGAGYRYLHVDQEQKVDFDTDIYGPIFGLRISL